MCLTFVEADLGRSCISALISPMTKCVCSMRPPCERYLNRAPIASIIFSLNTSAGVFHPRHLRGVLLSWSQICLMSPSVIALMSRLRGSQRRARRLVFSTVPFCEGDDG